MRTILTFTVLLGVTLSAHALSVSYAQFSVQDNRMGAIVRLPIDEVDLLLRIDADLDGQISAAELEAAVKAGSAKRAEYSTGTLCGVPGGPHWHQHFSTGSEPLRYLAIVPRGEYEEKK